MAMDALSTAHPVSSLRPKQFLSANPNNPPRLLKPPPATQSHASLPPFANLSAKPNSASSLAPKPIPARSSSLRSPPRPVDVARTQYCKAATGYAAALLDVAACDGQLAAVAKDVRRFTRAVHAVLEDEEVGGAVKGEVLTMVVEAGGFYAKLAVLVRMLVRKGKVRMVGEVMEEFGRLWGELCRKQTKQSANGMI